MAGAYFTLEINIFLPTRYAATAEASSPLAAMIFGNWTPFWSMGPCARFSARRKPCRSTCIFREIIPSSMGVPPKTPMWWPSSLHFDYADSHGLDWQDIPPAADGKPYEK